VYEHVIEKKYKGVVATELGVESDDVYARFVFEKCFLVRREFSFTTVILLASSYTPMDYWRHRVKYWERA
jgi:hypothetical protein